MTCQLLRNDGPEYREEDPWEVFIPDEDEWDPEPQPGGFWSGDFWPDEDLPFTDAARCEVRARANWREVLPCSL